MTMPTLMTGWYYPYTTAIVTISIMKWYVSEHFTHNCYLYINRVVTLAIFLLMFVHGRRLIRT